ncbi:MAG TPA: hypothetical protein VMF03_03895 [Steroidobacteraceae bacterium]|nr:hypothetical protein [Steroidobacteraceae bacterium]
MEAAKMRTGPGSVKAAPARAGRLGRVETTDLIAQSVPVVVRR